MKLRMLFGLGLAALISCSQSDESILAKKAKEEFLKNEDKLYQDGKITKKAEPIGYYINKIIKSDNINDIGEYNVGWAAENCQLNAIVEQYKFMDVFPKVTRFEGALETVWVELAAKCPEEGCFFLETSDYIRIEYGFVRDKNNEWCHFMNSFKFNNGYFKLSKEDLKDFKKL